MIFLDTETTGLIDTHLLPKDKLPEIIELYMVDVDIDTGEVGREFDHLIRPVKKITNEITRMNGITQAMVEDCPAFRALAPEIAEIIEHADCVVAHNLSFDAEMIDVEMERHLGRALEWPKKLCTVEATIHLKGFRLTLTALHELLFSEKFPEAHRAKNDVMAMVRCVIELRKRGEI